MTVKSIWLRRIHKWVGLVIGLQFVLWTISGAAMALLDMETVAGGPRPEGIEAALSGEATGWRTIVDQIDLEKVEGLRLKTLLDRPVVEVRTARSTRMFDARTGEQVRITAAAARTIAQSNHPSKASPGAAKLLTERSLPVREHEPPIWQVEFADEDASTYYVSATTGAVLERRNDTWRWWDFFWMLHNMDYSDRTSFNHPLIITAGMAMAWLAVTGFWLLFRTMWRHDFAWLRRRRTRQA
ncbi:PepSY domain-containing protein [Porphyrobacter sp. GA68]|uniref:PepSY domain-containing protein n=1 Tax=Porphyrobacter sp. GA68 TaxID=2883480 RepID=UPI001D19240F|nr:PepSY domain-containing protein [Porphyrobacter sp. GA68]